MEGKKAQTGETVPEDDDQIISLDGFFMNENYQLTTFNFGSHAIQLYCLQSASTDFDLTGQLVWPGAMLLNDYLSKNVELLKGCSVIELGSGIGITGILCSKYCPQVVMTDHNDEVLKIIKRNIDLHSSSENSSELAAEKLEWGNPEQINEITHRYPKGFDLILGADICFQQASISLLFDTVKQLIQIRGKEQCMLILGYVSRAKTMDAMVISEARGHGMLIEEVAGTRSVVGHLEGVVYEITLQ